MLQQDAQLIKYLREFSNPQPSLLIAAGRISDMGDTIERLIIENEKLNLVLDRIYHIATQRQANDSEIASHFDTGWLKVMQIADPNLRVK